MKSAQGLVDADGITNGLPEGNDTAMKTKANRKIITNKAQIDDRHAITGRLLCWYTFLFIVFYAAVFSPFWVYGKACLWGTDGINQQLPTLTYSKQWYAGVMQNLLQGNVEIPYWSMEIGFGQNTFLNAINIRFFNLLFALFPYSAIEFFLLFRVVLSLYLTGIAFILYGRTRVRNDADLLLGCMLYVFSSFTIYFAVRHTFFLEMTITMPLMLLGVDQIYDGKWSPWFIFAVALEGLSNFYLLFMITVPAVVYAAFHFFELRPQERSERGGLIRILLRHIVQYVIGLCLAAISLLPSILMVLGSSRTSSQSGVSMLHWRRNVYLSFFRGIVGMEEIGIYGFIALPSIALLGVLFLMRSKKRQDRLIAGQILLYTLVYLVPVLTMIFSGLAGKTMRWCYIFAFWTALGTACILPKIRMDDGRGHRICLYALVAYSVVYMAITIWKDATISVLLALVAIAFVLYYALAVSKWGRERKKLVTVMLFVILLVEVTTKSYQLYSPQYSNYIASAAETGKLYEFAADNPSDALDMVTDDSVYRTDVLLKTNIEKENQANYGMRNGVNGISSYYSYTNGAIVNFSLDMGNAEQAAMFKIKGLDERTVLNELVGVKYATTFEDARNRIPYGYKVIGSRKKTLSTGTVVNEYVYRNEYFLPLAYSYDKCITRETFDALLPNQREQALLQGVLVETEPVLEEAELSFDDQVVLDKEAILEVVRKIAKRSDYLDIDGDVIRIKESKYSVSVPLPGEFINKRGELSLQCMGTSYRSVNYSKELAEKQEEQGKSRITTAALRRTARRWNPSASATLTADCGSLSDAFVYQEASGQYYFGERDVLLNLGYGQTGSTLKLTFSATGEYSFDDIALILQPMEDYPKKVEKLRKNSASSVDISGNTVTVRYNLDHSALACLAVPYSLDWSACVDGEKAELLQANGMFMGVMLPEGEHTVVFRNRTRGFLPGVIISLVSFHALILIVVLKRRKRDKTGPDASDAARRAVEADVTGDVA